MQPRYDGARAGSSPRMRGPLFAPWGWCVFCGIIPAHAGNTGDNDRQTFAAWDHPRACGEHCSSTLSAVCMAGSSPRMRGTLIGDLDGLRKHGIIPAHAGNTR